MTEPTPATREPLWSPSAERAATTNLARFVAAAQASGYHPPDASAAVDFPSLYAWSIQRPYLFWPAVWHFCGVVADALPDGRAWTEVVHGLERMAPPGPVAGPTWF